MAELVEWDDIETQKKGKSGGGGNSGKFVKLGANTKRKVRPLRKPVRFFKVGNTNSQGRYTSAVIAESDIDMIKSKFPKVSTQQRRACLVFDRDEGNELRILEGPVSMFESFKHFKNISKNEPGGPQGGDFVINTICPNDKKDRDTTYEVEFVNPTPFTSEEKSQYEEKSKEYDLQEIYKALTIEEIEARLFGDGGNQNQSQSQAQTQSSSPSQNDGLGGGSESKDDDPLDW